MTLPDRDDLATFGGAFSNAHDVVDPTTDMDASYHNKLASDVAMMTRTAIRALARFVTNGTNAPNDASGLVHMALWGASVSVKPVVARTGVGVYTVTWPTTVADELSVTHTVSLAAGWIGIEGATPYLWTVTMTAANVASVRIFNATTGAAADTTGVGINVFAV
jgi:hypothetical protein